MSESAGLSGGVPQGSVSGPIVFLFFLQVSSSVHLFADDILLYGSFKPSLKLNLVETEPLITAPDSVFSPP